MENAKRLEAADSASPRTLWSAYNRKEIQTWRSCHQRNTAHAAAYGPAPPNERRLVLFGDSITESWRGTSYCRRVPRAYGVPDVLNATLGTRWPAPLPLGIAADCTQHLLWRMAHGELTSAMAADPRLTSVLLIGTNNLGRGHTVDETVRGVRACASHLLNGTQGKLLVNALLPRGDKRKKSRRKGESYLRDILAVNAQLNRSVAALGAQFPGRVQYVDCGAGFWTPGTLVNGQPAEETSELVEGAKRELVRRELMPDRLHPNALGHKLWDSCLLSAITAADW